MYSLTLLIRNVSERFGACALSAVDDDNFPTADAVDILVVAEVPPDSARPKRTPRIKEEVTQDEHTDPPVPKRQKCSKRKKNNELSTVPPKKKPRRNTVQPLGVSLRSSDNKKRSSRTSAKAREAAKLLEK